MKELFEEDSPVAVPNHILFTYFDFMFLLYLPILKVSCIQPKWLKNLNFKGPNKGLPILVPQILSNFIKFYLNYLLIFAYPENLICVA